MYSGCSAKNLKTQPPGAKCKKDERRCSIMMITIIQLRQGNFKGHIAEIVKQKRQEHTCGPRPLSAVSCLMVLHSI